MNSLPYYYDDLWKQHEIEYLKFNNYIYKNDLSYTINNCISIILLFEFQGKHVLRGYNDGILFPQINNFDIENIHVNKKKDKVLEILYYINNIFEEYNIQDTKIYQNIYDSFKIRYSIFSILDTTFNFVEKNKLEIALIYDNTICIDDIEKCMESGGVRNIINKFNKNPPTINIYFGNIPDIIFDNFVKKHFELAERKTKPEICWNILKTFILEKKAILVESNNNFVMFNVSRNYCYYSINACNRKDKIVSYLLYSGIKWLLHNHYNNIHFGSYANYYKDEKNINIAKFKKGFCNKLFNSYYLS
jgi:hypothetical protein